jgi:hypothetical protein
MYGGCKLNHGGSSRELGDPLKAWESPTCGKLVEGDITSTQCFGLCDNNTNAIMEGAWTEGNNWRWLADEDHEGGRVDCYEDSSEKCPDSKKCLSADFDHGGCSRGDPNPIRDPLN